MDAFLSCFACGDKSSAVVTPEKKVEMIQVKEINNLQLKQNINNVRNSPIQQLQDDKSRVSMTTATFITSETAPSKNGDQDSDMRRRIQLLLQKELPQRKAMEAEYVKQNLTKSKTVYLIQKRWSEQYTKFLKDHKIQGMRPINNESLLDNKSKLKSNMKQKEDYFIITERVWKFVQALYGGGPAIPKDIYFPVISLQNKRQEVNNVGMKNPLNLCYMIACLQCFLSMQQMNHHFYKKLFLEGNDPKKKPYSMMLHRLIKMVLENKTTLDINDFAVNFQQKFEPKEQHDAHQFFTFLIEKLQEQGKMQSSSKALKAEFPDSQSAYTAYFTYHKSIVDRIFAGQTQTSVVCGSCDYTSVTFSPFFEIILSLKGASLEECLKENFSMEKLSDYYECQKCKNKTKAMKQTCITKTPNFLVIVMKKFTSTGKKIEDRISYQHKLDIKKYCKGHYGQFSYLLHSVIIHKGSRSTKGHYYCFTRRHRNDWVYFNDETIKQIDSKDAIGRDPYILIYERQR